MRTPMWRRLAALLAISPVVGGLALFAYVAANRHDAPSPGDGDLLVERPAVADTDNGFVDLEAAAEALRVSEEIWPSVSRMLLGEAWDASLVEALLADNREALALADRASRAPGFASTPFRDIDDPLPNLLRWQQVARLFALRGIRDARARDAEASIASALTSLRLARLILADREAVLIHAMIANAIAGIGSNAITVGVRYLEPTAAQSRTWTNQLEELHVDPEAWRAIWAAEYRIMRNMWVEAGTHFGETGFEESMEPEATPAIDLVWRILPSDYLFQPNRAIMLHAELVRSYQQVAGQPCASMGSIAEPDAEPIRYLVRPNEAGRILASISAPNLRRFEFRRCHLQTRIEATRAQIAVRAYEIETGRLPEALADLVPRYLESPPKDFFVGGLLGYDRTRRELRSPGADLVGDAACDDGPAMLEPCFSLAAAPEDSIEHAALP